MEQNTTPDPQGNEYPVFDLDMPDDRLGVLFRQTLSDSIAHWNNAPFELDKNDTSSMNYFIGKQLDERYVTGSAGYFIPYIDNRTLTSARAVLAYVNSRIAKPDITPSNGEKSAIAYARDMESIMYQHGVDQGLKVKVKKSAQNLVVRKRAYLKLRFNPELGEFGDIEVCLVDPADIVVDWRAKFGLEPDYIFHKDEMTVEEMIAKFPDKKEEILRGLDIQRLTTSQKRKTQWVWECWFVYYDNNVKKYGTAWYADELKLVLGKMQNPNFIYGKSPEDDRRLNYLPCPINPFIPFNYLNLGKSYIDETSLLEQIRPLQDILNRRGRQIVENADYANGKIVADSEILSQEDANKFMNKSPKTILLAEIPEGKTLSQSLQVIPHSSLPSYVIEDKYDLRNEIDQIMGTPNVFRGEESGNKTLGQDRQIIEQAGALQDDLASAIDDAMAVYYKKLYHMMKVYYTEDHFFQIKGENGKYDFITLKADNIDTKIKITVESGSTLPSNKTEMRNTALELAKMNRISDLDLFEMIGMPEPEKMAERLNKQLTDPAAYGMDIENERFNREADTDLKILLAGQIPGDREEYSQAYLEHFNHYMMGTKFPTLLPNLQEAIKVFVAKIAQMLARAVNIQEMNPGVAGMADQMGGEMGGQVGGQMEGEPVPPQVAPQNTPQPA
jgi:hypothetical protein